MAKGGTTAVGSGGKCARGKTFIAPQPMVLGTMATKAVRGENVGKMFVTRPEPTEYELYQEGKRAREAKEAEAAAAVKAKAALGQR